MFFRKVYFQEINVLYDENIRENCSSDKCLQICVGQEMIGDMRTMLNSWRLARWRHFETNVMTTRPGTIHRCTGVSAHTPCGMLIHYVQHPYRDTLRYTREVDTTVVVPSLRSKSQLSVIRCYIEL